MPAFINALPPPPSAVPDLRAYTRCSCASSADLLTCPNHLLLTTYPVEYLFCSSNSRLELLYRFSISALEYWTRRI